MNNLISQSTSQWSNAFNNTLLLHRKEREESLYTQIVNLWYRKIS